jgi:hypothetical protein
VCSDLSLWELRVDRSKGEEIFLFCYQKESRYYMFLDSKNKWVPSLCFYQTYSSDGDRYLRTILSVPANKALKEYLCSNASTG